MAKSSRGKTVKAQSKPKEIVETTDSVVESAVDETKDDVSDMQAEIVEAVEADVDADAAPDDAKVSDADEGDTGESDADTAAVSDDSAPEKDAPLEDTAQDPVVEPIEDADEYLESPAEAAETIPKPTAEPQVIRETVVERKGGFASTALGGVVAAALGFGAAQFTDVELPFFPKPAPNPFEQEARTAIDTQGQQIATMVDQISDTQKAVEIIDLTPIMTTIAGLEDQIAGTSGTLTAIGEELAGFDSRLTAIEKAPMANALSPESIAAYERELDALRQSVTDQQAALEAQRTEIQAMTTEALQAEANSEDNAALAASRAALAEVTALVQTGKPFAGPLSVLTANGVAIPEALSAAAADGVPTLATLAGEFPDLARKALSAARRSGEPDETGGGFGAFLQKQLGARSVTPQEGNDADAVLSRAEAAVNTGDLETALTEIEALPDAAKAELAGWLVQAGAQRDAVAAIATLSQDLNNQ